MNKTYRYRPHIAWAQSLCPAFFSAIGLGVLAVLIVPAVGTPAFLEMALLWVPTTLLMFLAPCVYCWHSLFRMAGTSFGFADDAMVHTTREGVTHHSLDAVYLKPVGGVLEVRSGTNIVRITGVLQDISGFVMELKNRLDAKHLSSHYDADELLRFYTYAVGAEDSWDSMYAYMGKTLLLLGNLCGACGVGYVNGAHGRAGLGGVGAWLLFSFFYWCSLVPGIVDTRCMRRRIRIEGATYCAQPALDGEQKEQAIGNCFLWGSVAYMLLSVGVIVWVRCG